MAWRENISQDHEGFVPFLMHALIRFFQFVLGITVCGLYGTDLNNAREQGKYADSKWVFAVVVGAMGAVSALIEALPFIRTVYVFAWDWIML